MNRSGKLTTRSADRSQLIRAATRLRQTGSHRLTVVARLVAGVPLLGIGIAHVVVPEAPMGPLVEAAGIPFAGLVAPVSVGVEIVAGLSLILGLWARVGGLLAIPTMLGALYAHLVIDVWPNGPENEPPLLLPIAVLVGAAYVVRRGAGRWSLDHRTRP
ncbi:DoxX family protein [Nocardioides limicola]|uniref:DoxX family protein n=1 Tax=Nocardioides limicola TaxID=2803368 RepID=UPI00193B73F3|nr:DoxX family protein [Nocardioides sp. DJM-14]